MQNGDIELMLDDKGLRLIGERGPAAVPAGGCVFVTLSGRWRRYCCELLLKNGENRRAGGVQYRSGLCMRLDGQMSRAGRLTLQVSGGDLLKRELSQTVSVDLAPQTAV